MICHDICKDVCLDVCSYSCLLVLTVDALLSQLVSYSRMLALTVAQQSLYFQATRCAQLGMACGFKV